MDSTLQITRLRKSVKYGNKDHHEDGDCINMQLVDNRGGASLEKEFFPARSTNPECFLLGYDNFYFKDLENFISALERGEEARWELTPGTLDEDTVYDHVSENIHCFEDFIVFESLNMRITVPIANKAIRYNLTQGFKKLMNEIINIVAAELKYKYDV